MKKLALLLIAGALVSPAFANGGGDGDRTADRTNLQTAPAGQHALVAQDTATAAAIKAKPFSSMAVKHPFTPTYLPDGDLNPNGYASL
jgi:hypothetical protein